MRWVSRNIQYLLMYLYRNFDLLGMIERVTPNPQPCFRCGPDYGYRHIQRLSVLVARLGFPKEIILLLSTEIPGSAWWT